MNKTAPGCYSDTFLSSTRSYSLFMIILKMNVFNNGKDSYRYFFMQMSGTLKLQFVSKSTAL